MLSASKSKVMPWTWRHGSDGATLLDNRGRIRGQAFPNGTWHSFDERGVGCENDVCPSQALAEEALILSSIRQGWTDLVSKEE